MKSSEPRHVGMAWGLGFVGFCGLLFFGAVALYVIYVNCRIEVPTGYMAILLKKTGQELSNNEEIAPSEEFKGVQRHVLGEGRFYYNPYHWDWDVVPQVEIPAGKIGIRIRLHGDDLPYGDVLATKETQKGIVPGVMQPGRYPYNAWVVGTPRRYTDNYAELIELFEPLVIPAGFKGVVTNLSGPMPKSPNVLLVEKGERGVQKETLDAGTQTYNPYETRINLIDCRSQRFNLSSDGEMGFPSKDGFWVTLDGIIEFRVKPEDAARVLVVYNEVANDKGTDATVNTEIINKVILPNARSFCRLRGSDHSGKDFISGDTRLKFQEDFQKELEQACESQGIEIIQALITRINPPQKIAGPARDRQIAVQRKGQFEREILQQASEQQLAIEKETVRRKQMLVDSERDVVKVTTEAERSQEVTIVEANQRLKVAELELKAGQDLAAAIASRGESAAKVIEFNNAAEAAGWKKAVAAFGGDGNEYARWVLLKKLAPAYRQIMVNTADSPLMDVFKQFAEPTKKP